jgi:hypothetical protein
VSGGHPYPLLMALKLRARSTGSLGMDDEVRRQLLRAEQMRQAQATNNPPLDTPWSMFDLAEIRLYLGDAAGFLKWVKAGLEASQHRYEPETFRSALQLLVDGGAKPDGLDDGLKAVDARIPTLP